MTTPTDEKTTVANPQEEIEKIKSQAEEYLNNWKRERADFLNYKKDELKRIEVLAKFANEGLLIEFLDMADSIEIAAKNMKGLEPIVKQLQDFLKKHNIEKINVEGEEFDPELHEAVETVAGGEKLEEVRSGYTLHDKVIRPARVKIIK